FLKDISYRDLIREFRDLVKEQMGRDERFAGVTEEEKVDLFLDSWIYVHGFATLIATGYFENPTNEFIKTRLIEAPASLLYKRLEKRSNKK
ncbi:MAG: TetR/AcrR family transcriptional regulator, partial [Fusobacteriaceae bacterium]